MADPKGPFTIGNGGDAPSQTPITSSDERRAEVDEPMHMGSSDFMLVDEDDPRTKRSLRDHLAQFGPKAREKMRRTFTRKLLYKRLPVLGWLPRYSVEDGVGDLVAGITVGLTVIPQALAYSNIAGLPPQYGLYGAFLGSLLYILLGSSKDVSMGPTAIASLLTFQAVNHLGPEHAIPHAVLLCFLAGLVMLLMGLLQLGFLLDFVSDPVSSGFTSAVALIIVSSQVKDLLGIGRYVSGNTFVEMWSSIFEHIGKTRLWDTLLGAASIAVLLTFRYMARVYFGPKDPERRSTAQKLATKIVWLLSVTRNALLVFVTGGIAYAFYSSDLQPFVLIGEVPAGLPAFRPPPFSSGDLSFGDMLGNLGAAIAVVPLLGILENMAVCKAFAGGKAVDATQEMIAVGLGNIGNSFVQAYPGTGALARSAVFNASGVRTSMGNVYSGLLVIISLLFFTDLFFYIPKAALAAIIVAAVIFMVEVRVVRPMWRTKKIDLIPAVATFVCCLAIRIEVGILVGIGLNVVFIMHQAARPKIAMRRCKSREGCEYLLLTPDRCLIFPSVAYVRNLVTKHGSKAQLLPVVIDCSHIYGADFTAAGVVESMTADFAARGQPLFFYNLKPSVVAVFEGLQPKEFVCVYEDDHLDSLLKDRLQTPSV